MKIGKADTSIATGALWYFFEKSMRLLGGFLIGAWLARYLGPETFGMYAFCIALSATFGFMGSLGIESLVVRDLVEGKRPRQQIISTYFYIRLIGSMTVPFLVYFYLTVTHQSDTDLLLIAILCSGAVFFSSFDVADCWLQAMGQVKKTSLIRLAGLLIGLAFRCLLLMLNSTVEWFAALILLEAITIAILYFRLLRREGLTPSLEHVNINELKHLLLNGKMMVISGLIVAIYSKIDLLAIGTLLPKKDAGAYAIAASICSAWNLIGMSLAQAWAPHITRAKLSDNNEYIKSLRRLLATMIVISVCGSFLLTLGAQFIFAILLGDQYGHGIQVLIILIWSSVFVYLGVGTSQIIVNEQIYWISVMRSAIGLIFYISIVYALPIEWNIVKYAALMVATSAIATLSILISANARQIIIKILSK